MNGERRRPARWRECTVRLSAGTLPGRNHEYGFWGGESEDERHAAGYRLIAPIGVRARAG